MTKSSASVATLIPVLAIAAAAKRLHRPGSYGVDPAVVGTDTMPCFAYEWRAVDPGTGTDTWIDTDRIFEGIHLDVSSGLAESPAGGGGPNVLAALNGLADFPTYSPPDHWSILEFDSTDTYSFGPGRPSPSTYVGQSVNRTFCRNGKAITQAHGDTFNRSVYTGLESTTADTDSPIQN